MGSIKVDEEPDRVHLRNVLMSHNWTTLTATATATATTTRLINLRIFDDLVRAPDTTTRQECVTLSDVFVQRVRVCARACNKLCARACTHARLQQREWRVSCVSACARACLI